MGGFQLLVRSFQRPLVLRDRLLLERELLRQRIQLGSRPGSGRDTVPPRWKQGGSPALTPTVPAARSSVKRNPAIGRSSVTRCFPRSGPGTPGVYGDRIGGRK